MLPGKIYSYEDHMCRQLVQIKWLLVTVLVFIAGTVLAIVISAYVFRSQVTELNAAETNQFLSDVFTMAANGRSASQDAPVLMKSITSIAKLTADGMQDNNSTSISDIMDTVSSVLTEENLKYMADSVSQIPWEETVLPMAQSLLKNTENMEQIILILMSALQQEKQPHYVVAEISKES